jgi:hypothetical protein
VTTFATVLPEIVRFEDTVVKPVPVVKAELPDRVVFPSVELPETESAEILVDPSVVAPADRAFVTTAEFRVACPDVDNVVAEAAANDDVTADVNVFAEAAPRLDVVAFNILIVAVAGTDNVLPPDNVTFCKEEPPCTTSDPTVADPMRFKFPLLASTDMIACSVSFSHMKP